MQVTANKYLRVIGGVILLLFSCGCGPTSYFDQPSVMDACRRNDTNYFVLHASEINQRLKGPGAQIFTYALIEAAMAGSTNIVEQLLQLGADPQVKDFRNRNALIWLAEAAEGNPGPTMSKLLDAGLDVNAQDRSCVSALHCAAQTGEASAVDFLLKSGARRDAIDFLGNTPLHLVGKVENAKLLLAAGASLSVTNKAGQTPVEFARIHRPVVYKYYLELTK